mmetsp:Transcript_2704/g.3708  ORF Transcript_2704/g.3708 Transcript_2704/m.3708 type:complete len:476 (+) Transcript_2704:517-1944(+)
MKSNISSNDYYVKHLIETEKYELDDWTSIAYEADNLLNQSTALQSYRGVYVNLLQNPERFTGYAGPSAHRVWHAIQEENCFGGLSDTCLEKRIFSRLMSGLQASISTHIARDYLFSTSNSWGENPELFMKAVGHHSDRLQNLYFTFLFVLRAVVKAGDILIDYNYNTGNATDDAAVRQLITSLVGKASRHSSSPAVLSEPQSAYIHGNCSCDNSDRTKGIIDNMAGLEECKHGFDETEMFQMSAESISPSTSTNDKQHEEKHLLREDFKNKFRNISRIMDCVGCEKCRLWGKLQILGIGTAIKVLLMTPAIKTSAASEKDSCQNEDEDGKKFELNRQEVIALVNTLHQLSKSVEFASHIMNDYRLSKQQDKSSHQQPREVVDDKDNNQNNEVVADASSDTMKSRPSSSSRTTRNTSTVTSISSTTIDSLVSNDSYSYHIDPVELKKTSNPALMTLRHVMKRFLAGCKSIFHKLFG